MNGHTDKGQVEREIRYFSETADTEENRKAIMGDICSWTSAEVEIYPRWRDAWSWESESCPSLRNGRMMRFVPKEGYKGSTIDDCGSLQRAQAGVEKTECGLPGSAVAASLKESCPIWAIPSALPPL